MTEYPTEIIKCPDCGVECNYVANCFAEMPFSYPGNFHPHQCGSRDCLEKQVKNLQAKIKKRDRVILGMLNSVAETLKGKHKPEDFYCPHLRALAEILNWSKDD